MTPRNDALGRGGASLRAIAKQSRSLNLMTLGRASSQRRRAEKPLIHNV